MNKPFSIYLDLARFIASLAVFFEHLASTKVSTHVLHWRLGGYGAIAVTVFFVLSGYVIAHVIAMREKTGWKYASSRFSRLYSVLFLALAVTYLADNIGMKLNQDFYAGLGVTSKSESLPGYLSALFFVNEYQAFHVPGLSAGSNGPLWSLSFEATYYLLAGLIVFSPAWVSIVGVAAIFLLAGKTILALAPLWWLGYLLYRYRDKLVLPQFAAVALFFGSLAFMVLLPGLGSEQLKGNFGYYFPWNGGTMNRNLFSDYAAALAFSIHLIAARQILYSGGAWLLWLERPIRYVGSLTFPLYCLHYPLLFLFASVSPWHFTSRLHILYLATATMAIILVLTPVCDYLKNLFKKLLETA